MTRHSSTDPIYLRPTWYINGDHPDVAAFARETAGEAGEDRERAVRLFYAVRDGIRYDPYTPDLLPERFRASTALESGATFCIPKAILLAASARVVGIPSRLRFCDVRNHLTTPHLREIMRTDRFVFHGLTELFLGGKWIKATPTFNLSLCEKFGVKPLDFDGENDAVLHPFDQAGKRHMEYLLDRGAHADFPRDEMLRAYGEHYPHLFDEQGRLVDPDLAGDFEREAAGRRWIRT
jgi:transglutaminase-like putative cysteine protease